MDTLGHDEVTLHSVVGKRTRPKKVYILHLNRDFSGSSCNEVISSYK